MRFQKKFFYLIALIVGVVMVAGVSTAGASEAPAKTSKYSIYNQRGSAYAINVYSGANCTGTHTVIGRATKKKPAVSFQVNAMVRYKVGTKGKYKQIQPNVCVTNRTKTTYMSVFVYNYHG